MNLQEVKRVGPSLPGDIDFGFEAFCKYVDKNSDYQVSEGDVLVFVVGRIAGNLTLTPLRIYRPDPGVTLERLGVLNTETSIGDSHALKFHTLDFTTGRLRFSS